MKLALISVLTAGAALALSQSSGGASEPNPGKTAEEAIAQAQAGDFGCCSGWGEGDIHAPLVLYGAHLVDKKNPKKEDKTGGRHEGFLGIDVKKELAIRLVGSTCYEKADAGHFLFRCPTNNKLTAVAWGPSGCTSYDWPDTIPFPKQCVGNKGMDWYVYRDSVKKDMWTHLLRYQPPCKMATIAVNPVTCIPHEATMNLTHHEKPKDLLRNGAHGRGGFSLNNLKWFEPKENKHRVKTFKTAAGVEVPEGWRCTEGLGCHTIEGYVALSFRNTEARRPDANYFGIPSWCEKGKQLMEACGVHQAELPEAPKN